MGLAPQTQPTTLREILRVVFLYRYLVLGTLCAFSLTAGGLAYLTPDEYVASVSLWLRDETSRLRQTGESPREQYERIQTAAANFREVALSKSVLQSVAEEVFGERFRAMSPEDQAELLEDLRKRISFQQRRSSEFGASQVIQVNVRHRDRRLAARLLERLLEASHQALREAGKRHAENLVGRLRESLELERSRLRDAVANLDKFIEEVGAGIFDVQATGETPGSAAIVREELVQVDRELSAAEGRLQAKQILLRRLTQVVQEGETAPAEFLEAYPEISRVRQALLDAEVEQRTLQAMYAPEHPDLLDVTDRVNELRSLYHEQLQKLQHSIAAEVAVLKQVRDELSERREALAERLAGLAGRYAELLSLRSDVEMKRDAVRQAEARLAAAEVQLITAGQTAFFVPLGRIEASARPVTLGDGRVTALGACLGLLCGIGLAFLANHYSHTVRHETDLVRWGIDAPVLASIPAVDEPLPAERN